MFSTSSFQSFFSETHYASDFSRSVVWSFISWFPIQNTFFFCWHSATYPSHPCWSDHPSRIYTKSKAPYKKLFHMQFLPLFPKYFVPKYPHCPNLGLFGPFSYSLIPRYKVAWTVWSRTGKEILGFYGTRSFFALFTESPFLTSPLSAQAYSGDFWRAWDTNSCSSCRYRLEPHYDSNDEFHLLRNGSLRAPYLFPDLLTPNDYCLEVFQDSDTEEEEVLPLVCFPESQINDTPIHVQYILYSIGKWLRQNFTIRRAHLSFQNFVASARRHTVICILIVVLPCVLIITQLLFQQNALVY
jgi:hypothetical protein